MLISLEDYEADQYAPRRGRLFGPSALANSSTSRNERSDFGAIGIHLFGACCEFGNLEMSIARKMPILEYCGKSQFNNGYFGGSEVPMSNVDLIYRHPDRAQRPQFWNTDLINRHSTVLRLR